MYGISLHNVFPICNKEQTQTQQHCFHPNLLNLNSKLKIWDIDLITVTSLYNKMSNLHTVKSQLFYSILFVCLNRV